KDFRHIIDTKIAIIDNAGCTSAYALADLTAHSARHHRFCLGWNRHPAIVINGEIILFEIHTFATSRSRELSVLRLGVIRQDGFTCPHLNHTFVGTHFNGWKLNLLALAFSGWQAK